MARARTVFFGSGAFAVPVLDVVARAPELELAAVVTAPPRPVGRRAVLTPTPVGVAAARLAVPVLVPERLRDPVFLGAVAGVAPTLGVLADYGKILPAVLLDLPAHGIVNLHPSLLPRHRGASPIPAAILAGDEVTGVSLIRMDAGLDTGPIVAAEATPLGREEDAPALEARLARLAAALLGRWVGPYLAGDAVPAAQPADGATLTRPLAREDGRLDAALPAADLERRIRAYRPWPGTFLDLAGGDRLAVLAAEVAPGSEGDEPGTIVADGTGLALATAAGRLRLLAVRPAGGRPMDAAAYRRGRPAVVGTRLA